MIIFILGMMFGGFIGMMTTALCVAAKDADRRCGAD